MRAGEIFINLRTIQSAHEILALSIEDYENILIGVDRQTRPYLLIQTSIVHNLPSLETSNVRLIPSRPFTIKMLHGSETRGIFHILRCDGPEFEDHVTFLLMVDAFLGSREPGKLEYDELFNFFLSLKNLFSTLRFPDYKSERIGLWGELFVMQETKGFQFWGEFWRSEPNRLFDFNTKGQRLEVKSTTSDQRTHMFSHRQVFSQANDEIVIASLMLQTDDAGLSLRSLISECERQFIENSNMIKLQKAVREAGMENPNTIGPLYEESYASANMQFIRAIDAPHFNLPEPIGVSGTRYRINLDSATTLTPTEYEDWICLWNTGPKPFEEAL